MGYICYSAVYMGKTSRTKVKRQSRYVDPAVESIDQLAVIDARNMLFSNFVSMGWRLAIMVLVPIFIGVQIDKWLDSSPSVTLAAFFIAIFGAGVLIYRTYIDMNTQTMMQSQTKSTKKSRGKKNA